MVEDTIHTAYNRAKWAQAHGLHTIEVVCDAMHRENAVYVDPFPNCRGFVVKRIADDGLILQLIVRVDVTDILATAWDDYLRSLTVEQPKFRRRSLPHGFTSR